MLSVCSEIVALLLLLSLPILHFSAVRGDTRSIMFVKEPLAMAISRGYLLLEPTSWEQTLISCSVKCSSSVYCSMFLHNQTRQECAIFGFPNDKISSPILNDSSAWDSFVVDTNCSYMYMRFVHKCWMLHVNLEARSVASDLCNARNGRLIEFRSVVELTFLQCVLLSVPDWSNKDYWAGAVRSQGSNSHSWQSGLQAIEQSMWGPKQPDGYGSPPSQDCVDILSYFNFTLNDVACDQIRSVLCEMSV